jgi:predicted ATPase
MAAVSFDHLFVITGGPGSGKSTLIEELAKHGFAFLSIRLRSGCGSYWRR